MGSRKSSVRSTLRFHLSGSEDEQSLERIHTFNLKNDIRQANVVSKIEKKESPSKIKQPMHIKDLGIKLSQQSTS